MADSVLSVLLTFPPHPPNPQHTETDYNSQARKFQDALSKVQPDKLRAGIKGGEDFLEILNPAINSISYVHVLLAHITNSNSKAKAPIISDSFAPSKPLWQKMLKFMEEFDPIQIRYAGNEIRRLIEVTAHKAMTNQQPAAAIQPVRSALLRIDPTNATFTSNHPSLPQLCLQARDFAAALPVLDKDIYHFPVMTTKGAETTSDSLSPYLCSAHDSSSNYINTATGLTTKLEYQDHLVYYLWGAMCYIGLKDWDRAILFLEAVLGSPAANTASRIQTEAYKKWVLVSLLKQGKASERYGPQIETAVNIIQMGSLPKNTNSQASKMYLSLGRPYIGLAEVFTKCLENEESSARLVAEAHEGEKMWSDEFNTGLVRQVIDAYRYYSIRQLGDTYAALPITEVTQRTSHTTTDYAETGRYVSRIIDSGLLNASIAKPTEDPSSWYLRFYESTEDGPLSRSEQQQHDELTEQMAKVNRLMMHIKEADRKFGLSKEYINDQKRVQKAKEEGISGVEENWDMPPVNPFGHDEDIMAD